MSGNSDEYEAIIETLKEKFDELNAQNCAFQTSQNNMIIREQFLLSVSRDDTITIARLEAEVARTKRDATEAALRWAWGTNYDTHDCDGMVKRGLKALLGEGK